MADVETKVCRKCLYEKPIAEFTVTDRARGRLKARCKVCEAERLRDYYAANPQYQEDTKRRSVEWAKKNPERLVAHMRKQLLRKFGLKPEQYDALLTAQNGKCALCSAAEHGRNGKSGRHDGSRSWQEESWPIDHDHKSGHVRGLLCHTCNVRLGAYEALRDEIGFDKVEAYLSRPSPVVPLLVAAPPVYPKHEAAPPIRPRPQCSIEGCDKPHFANGLCGMHNARVRRGLDVGPPEELPRQTPRGASHPKSKLTDDDVRAIRASDERGIRLAERYGVTATLISNIRQRKVWKHVA